MSLKTVRARAALVTLFLTPWLTAADGRGCGGNAPIGGNDPPAGVACGSATCAAGEVCCNESCGICTPPDGACIEIACDPGMTPCGPNMCGAGEFCCNES